MKVRRTMVDATIMLAILICVSGFAPTAAAGTSSARSHHQAVNTRTAPAQAATTSQEPPLPEPKNLQMLKGLNMQELKDRMKIIAASLGVKCAFCHVTSSYDLDEKQNKLTARKMLAMTRDLNDRYFPDDRDQDGHRVDRVTCFTCHNGSAEPKSVPPSSPTAQ